MINHDSCLFDLQREPCLVAVDSKLVVTAVRYGRELHITAGASSFSDSRELNISFTRTDVLCSCSERKESNI